jgi:hypothetical protein
MMVPEPWLTVLIVLALIGAAAVVLVLVMALREAWRWPR